jgi:hypothetical protein
MFNIRVREKPSLRNLGSEACITYIYKTKDLLRVYADTVL